MGGVPSFLHAAGAARRRRLTTTTRSGVLGGGVPPARGPRRHIDVGRPQFETDRREREELAARFFDALRERDIEGQRKLLAADVQMVGDGGGKAPAFARRVIGADNVARVLASIFPVLADRRERAATRGERPAWRDPSRSTRRFR
jgi:hypothetical protein